MSKKSYALKEPYHVKKHTLFRGLRSYFSSSQATKTTPVVMTNQRARLIVENLSLTGNNVALLSFRKSMHNAIVILNSPGKYSYVSAYPGSLIFLDCFSKTCVIDEIADDERHMRAELSHSDVVYIRGLNTKKMMRYIQERELINHFDRLSNNCSRFTANVLIAGCDIKHARFQHDRPTWQMPANTTELAKEIDLFLRKRTLE